MLREARPWSAGHARPIWCHEWARAKANSKWRGNQTPTRIPALPPLFAFGNTKSLCTLKTERKHHSPTHIYTALETDLRFCLAKWTRSLCYSATERELKSGFCNKGQLLESASQKLICCEHCFLQSLETLWSFLINFSFSVNNTMKFFFYNKK